MNHILDKRYPVTSGILLVTWLVFLAMQVLRMGDATSAKTIFDFGGMFGLAIQATPDQLWRLVSAMFVHIGWQHIILNSLSIYFLGRQLEDVFGSIKFALFYFLSGIMGNAFVFFFTPDVIAAGASTAIFGLFASLAMLRYAARSSYIRILGQQYMTLLVLNTVLGFLSTSVSHVSHLGGASGGALCAIFIPIKGEEGIFTPLKRYGSLVFYVLSISGMVVFRLLM